MSRPPLRGVWGRVLPALRTVVFLALAVAVAGPVISRLANRTDPAELVILLEDSGSMSLTDEDPADGQTAATRWERALTLAAALDSAVTRINPDVQTRYLRGNGLEAPREFNLNDPVIGDPVNHGTDLHALLSQAGNRLLTHPVRGLVLLSDGQETVRRLEGRPSSTDAGPSQWTDGRPPVILGVGDPVGAADRLIKDLRYPDTAYAGDEVVVELAVVHQGGSLTGPVESRLRLSRQGETLADTVLTLQGASQQVELAFRPQGEGLQVYDLEVSALDNERHRDNNRVSLALDLRRSRSRILLLAARPGWDVRFLAQAAAREARLEMQVAFRREQGWTLADSLNGFVPPTAPDGWKAWESVILCGWEGLEGWLDWSVLAEAVEQGLGLWVLPGATQASMGLSRTVPAGLGALLPVTFDQPDWRVGPVFAIPSPDSEGHPVLAGLGGTGRATGTTAVPANDFSRLPPLEGLARVEIRPGALELLTARPGGGSAVPMLPLLVSGGDGAGPVVWFSGRRLWELSFWEPAAAGPQADDTLQPARQMLQNLLVWISSGQEDAGLRFAGLRPVYQEAERVRLFATWRDMRSLTVQDKALSVVLRRPGDDDTDQTFPLTASAGRAGQFEVDLPPLPPGPYQVQLRGEGDPPVLGAVEDLMVTSYSVEQTQVRQDRRNLAQLAAQLGGPYLQADSPAAVATAVAALAPDQWVGRPREMRHRLDFRSGWPFLLAVCLLLGLEWFIRRQQGLL